MEKINELSLKLRSTLVLSHDRSPDRTRLFWWRTHQVGEQLHFYVTD